MRTEAAAAGFCKLDGFPTALCELDGFPTAPRIQIVTVEEAMRLHHRAVDLPARRDDTFRKAARESRPDTQGALDL